MSSTGLYSGLYQTFYKAATLVDDVLVTLGTRNSCETDVCKELGQLLIDLASEEKRNLSVQMLAMALRDNHRLSPTNRREAGEALLSNQVDQQTLEVLEELSRVLEQMQAQSLSRMREGAP
jgi:hypothetical protein